MFSLYGLPFHLRSLIVKPGSVTGKHSGKESLWVLVVKREHLLTIVHPSLILFDLEIPWKPECTILLHMSIFVDYCVDCCTRARERERERDAARRFSSTFKLLFLMSESRCTADELRAFGGLPGLTPFLTVSCTLLKISIHLNTLPWLWQLPHTRRLAYTPLFHQNQVVHLCLWHYHPLPTTAYHWLMQSSAKKEPTPSSATMYWVHVQLSLPSNTHNSRMPRYLYLHVPTKSVNHKWT